MIHLGSRARDEEVSRLLWPELGGMPMKARVQYGLRGKTREREQERDTIKLRLIPRKYKKGKGGSMGK